MLQLPVFPNWYPFNDMLLDGRLMVGERGVKTRSYDWKYRGPVLLYNSGRTVNHCVRAYDYPKGHDRHRIIVGVAHLEEVRELTWRELRTMERNFNNLTSRQVRLYPWRAEIYPLPVGYFFTRMKRFTKPVPFGWPAGPVKPIFTTIESRSELARQLRVVGIR